MQKHLLTIAVAAVTGSLAFGTQAVAQDDPKAAQGLYSADDILGSSVYHVNDIDEEVGNVENFLLDDEGRVAAFIVSAGGVWGIGGEDVVVEAEHFTMETERDDADIGQGSVTHRILVDATEEELENFPSYEPQWFETERQRRIDESDGFRGYWQTTDAVDRSRIENENDAEFTDEDVVDDFE